MKPTTKLRDALWSNHRSQVLTGYDDSGQFIETERVVWIAPDSYEGAGYVYEIISWGLTGADYASREKS